MWHLKNCRSLENRVRFTYFHAWLYGELINWLIYSVNQNGYWFEVSITKFIILSIFLQPHMTIAVKHMLLVIYQINGKVLMKNSEHCLSPTCYISIVWEWLLPLPYDNTDRQKRPTLWGGLHDGSPSSSPYFTKE